ncbi:Uncharacterised protein [Escherichia coli]|uniref:Uncharacterized protein n=1 Tax=Escherichia coli TaxID=562 RepID=A0A377K539_ECOLX|nr:Uncharacterised protein [Escherichia coli]
MYIFITHFFAEYVIFKYLLSNITCRINYTAPFFQIIETPRKFSSSFAGYLSSIFLSYSIIFDSLRRSVM